MSDLTARDGHDDSRQSRYEPPKLANGRLDLALIRREGGLRGAGEWRSCDYGGLHRWSEHMANALANAYDEIDRIKRVADVLDDFIECEGGCCDDFQKVAATHADDCVLTLWREVRDA